ncbi:MAG: flagellar assembly protein FliX [Vitreimonas sp.]
MKVESGRSVGSAAGAKRAGSVAAPGFSVGVEETTQAAAAAGVSSVAALDTILALQAEEPLAQRRSRQAKRGRAALDALEKFEAGLLSGRAPGTLRQEMEHLRRTAEATGEPGLDEVLREIDTRLAVELAKLDRLAGNA